MIDTKKSTCPYFEFFFTFLYTTENFEKDDCPGGSERMSTKTVPFNVPVWVSVTESLIRDKCNYVLFLLPSDTLSNVRLVEGLYVGRKYRYKENIDLTETYYLRRYSISLRINLQIKNSRTGCINKLGVNSHRGR